MPAPGRKEWKRIVPELHGLGLLTVIDQATLEGYCAAYAQAILAEKHVKDFGLTIVTDKGFVVANPAVSMARNAWTKVVAFGAKFGLNPSDRSGINIKPASKPDQTKDFLRGRRSG